jgi:hypothetical protein
VSVTDAFSPTDAVNVHVPAVPGAIGDGGQLLLITEPTVPAVHAGVNPLAVKTLPYLLSQI